MNTYEAGHDHATMAHGYVVVYCFTFWGEREEAIQPHQQTFPWIPRVATAVQKEREREREGGREREREEGEEGGREGERQTDRGVHA